LAYEYDKTVLETWKGVVVVLTGSELALAYWQESRASEKLRMNDRGRLV